jgi:hypothetical protein
MGDRDAARHEGGGRRRTTLTGEYLTTAARWRDDLRDELVVPEGVSVKRSGTIAY